jgi:hypothetical protein
MIFGGRDGERRKPFIDMRLGKTGMASEAGKTGMASEAGFQDTDRGIW